MPRISIKEKVYQRLLSLKERRGGSISDSVASLLERVVGFEFDLLHTKDTGLVGAIGETFAWQYLWERGISAFELSGGRPSFKPRETTMQLSKHLTPEQILYLGTDDEHLSWDFAGYQGNRAFLIEVKTSRSGKRPDGLRPEGRRGMTPEDLREARRLGFTMLLVKVELTTEWQAIVTEREIPVD